MDETIIITPAVASELIRWVDLDWYHQVVRKPYLVFTERMLNLAAAMSNVDQASIVFKALVNEALTLGETVEWLIEELIFETHAFATGLRQLMNLDALMQHEESLSDADLDRFNLRKKRVYSFSFPN